MFDKMYEQTPESLPERRSVEVREEGCGSSQQCGESESGFGRKEGSGAKGLTVLIYILRCPISARVRYVGKTCMSLSDRLGQHLRMYKTDHKTSWLKSLHKQGLKPIIEEIERFENSDDEDWKEAERFWIVYFRFLGCNLTNMEVGGLGGNCLSEETRQKIALGNIGKNLGRKHAPRSEEYRRKIGDTHRGKTISEEQKEVLRNKVVSEETRRKMSEARKGIKLSAETRAKMSAAKKGKKGRPMTPEHKAKLIACHLGKPWTEASKEKLRATMIATNAVSRLRNPRP